MRGNPILRAALACGTLLLAALAGCEGYTYTLNERTVFDKPPLFREFEVADAQLKTCILQAIEDGAITSPDKLTDLNCSKAGITSLAGIETFAKLKRLGLDGNRIADLAPLARLKDLELLQLRDSGLRGLPASLCAGKPKTLALAGNGELACADLKTLAACGTSFSDLPEHCGSAN